ncbi:MAG: hypothetical protein HEP71_10585 [Roseivirga sp.]|nr:hypothetical protein [Roseivirga sp.]
MKYAYLLFLLIFFRAVQAQSGLHPKWISETEVTYYDRSGKIWIQNVESMERRVLTNGSQPAPNPKRKGVYALRKTVDGKSGIVIMDENKPDDFLRVDVDLEGLNAYHPIWSFDGNYLAFNAEHRENKTSTLYIYDYKKRKLTSYLEEIAAGAPSFFPNGDVLLPTYKGETFSLLRFNVKTGETTTLSSDNTRYFFADASPEGDRVVVGIMDKNNAENFDLWLLDLKSGKRKQLTNTPNKEFSARWSPSGKTLLVFFESGGKFHVITMDTKGKNIKNLTAQTND